jgi:transposase
MTKPKPKGTRAAFAARLTETEIKQLGDWTREGVPPREIATRLEICLNTAIKWQKRLGVFVPKLRKLDGQARREIIKLHHGGLGSRPIAKRTTFGEGTVLRVLKEAGIELKRGGPRRWRPTTKQFCELIDLSMAGNDSITTIAQKIAGPYGPVNRLVHRVRKCSAFLSTQVLDSYLPMKHRETKIGTSPYRQQKEDQAMLQILDFVRRACFEGKTPKDPAQLIGVAIGVCLMFFMRENPEVPIGDVEQEKVADIFMPRFQSALDAMAINEGGFVN